MKTTSLWAVAALSFTIAAVGCNCGGNPPVAEEDGGTGGGVGGGEGGGAGGGTGGGAGGGGGADQCVGASDPCLLQPGICPVDCSAQDSCDPSSGQWACGCSCPDGGFIDGGQIDNDAGTDAGQIDNDAGSNVCNVNPCNVCPANCSATDSCSANVWSCGCTCADGGVVDGGTIVTDGGVSPASICLDVARKECDYMIRCKAETIGNTNFRLNTPTNGASGSRGNNVNLTSTERDTCVRWLSNETGCLELAAGWDAGRSTVNQTAYFECIDSAYPSNTCDRDLNTMAQKCGGYPFKEPNTANGSLCVGDTDCAAGFCTVNSLACGTCQAYITDGGTCNRNAQCDPASTYCTGGFNARCANYVADGGTCQNNFGSECGPGAVCTGAFQSFTKKCAPGKLENDTCTKDSFQCLRDTDRTGLPELICATTQSGDKCVKLQSPKNGPCGNGENVVLSTNPFTLARGPFCEDTQFCNQGVCTDRRVAGQPCNSDDVCALGTHCVNSFCTAYLAAGGTCGQTSACQGLLSCQGTSCQPQYAVVGEACNTNVPCVTTDSFCSNGTCVDRLTTGQTCGGNAQCESGVCQTTCQQACWQ